ncbi:MAG: ubiquinol-cytochrome c reductase iron-sulfur subunit [Planctomyces sp.]
MTDPKPSTDDILSKIRAKAATPPSPPAAAPASSEPAAEASSEKPAAAAPQSTADILAAARAKAAPAKPAAAPGGTADILSAIKSQAKPAAAAPAGAAPKSPADIMAAIRGGAGAAKPATPAAAKPAAEAPKPAVATAGMSAADMIKAARVGESGTAAPPRVALPTKPLPGTVAATAAVPEETRRGFLETTCSTLLSPVVVAWTSFVGSLLASSLAVARFMMPNVLVEPPTRFKIGPPNDYAPGTVSTKWQAQFGIWVVNAEVDGAAVIYALSTVCTHLGCTPNWLEGEQKFKCPCHGSGFYKTGVNFEGPAPRPLERYGLRLAEDGMLEVDKSLKFQKELGQWSNPSCFVPVA